MENKFKAVFTKAIAVLAVVVMVICAVPVASLNGLDMGLATKAEAVETSGIYAYTVKDKEVTITSISDDAKGDIKIPSKLGGYPVTAIGDFATFYNTEITSITIPNSVETIGESAFTSCMSLKSVTIGKGLRKMSGNPFAACTELKTISISKDNPYFTVDDKGVVFNKDMTKLLICPSGARVFEYTVPDTVKSVAGYSFAFNSYLRSVTFPSSVTTIGTGAFYLCEDLETVTATDSIYKIGSDAFIYTAWLDAVENDVVYLGSAVCDFSGDEAPEKLIIKDGIKGIAEGAFTMIEGPEEIHIPASVVYIGSFAFNTDVEKIIVDENNSKFMSDGDGVLYTKDQKKLIAYPEGRPSLTYTVSDKTEEIGEGAFAFAEYLEEVTFLSSVKVIGDNAFLMAERLSKVNFGKNITDLGESAFSMCTSLESIKIPDGVKEIKTDVFAWCSSLKSVKLGKNVTKIGDYAFGSCSVLEKISLPASVTYIGEGAFDACEALKSFTVGKNVKTIKGNPVSGCTALKKIKIDSANKYFYVDPYGVLFNKKVTKLIAYPIGRTKTYYSVPKTVKVIGAEAFAFCSNLKKVAIPGSTKTIGEMAFEYCDKLEAIALHKVSHIKEYAFYGCDSLEKVYLSDNLKLVDDSAFDGCYELEEVYYSGTKKAWKKINFVGFNPRVTEGKKYYEHKHTYNKGKTASKATYLRDGFKLYTCSECGGVKSTVIDKLKLKKVTVNSLKSTKQGRAVVAWTPVEAATGYEIVYSTSKKFTSKTTKKVTVEDQKTKKRTLKKLKSGKKYYVKVRAYKVVSGTTVRGSYSKVMTVKVK